MVFFQRILYFSKDLESRGGQIFSRGVKLLSGWGGVQMLISIETHITCDFSGGGSEPPYPPLNPHKLVLLRKHTALCFSEGGSKAPVPNSGLEHDCSFGYLQVFHSSIGIMLKYFL